MATDYISRAGMMRHIEREAQEWGEDYDAMQILGDIEDYPAADVRPVVRGKWVPTGKYDYYYKCSVCKKIGPLDPCTESAAQYNFCPNCGADMRRPAT